MKPTKTLPLHLKGQAGKTTDPRTLWVRGGGTAQPHHGPSVDMQTEARARFTDMCVLLSGRRLGSLLICTVRINYTL